MSPFPVACTGAKTNEHLLPGRSSQDSCGMDQVMIQPGTPHWISQGTPAPQIPIESGCRVHPATYPMLMESRGVTSVRSGYWYKIPLLAFRKMRQDNWSQLSSGITCLWSHSHLCPASHPHSPVGSHSCCWAPTNGGFSHQISGLAPLGGTSQAALGQQTAPSTFSQEPCVTPALTHHPSAHLRTTKQGFHCSLPR